MKDDMATTLRCSVPPQKTDTHRYKVPGIHSAPVEHKGCRRPEEELLLLGEKE
jgi:hypothetical protein